MNIMKLMINKDGGLDLNMEDEILQGCVVTKDGAVINEQVKQVHGLK